MRSSCPGRNCDDLEAAVEREVVGVARKPGLGGAPQSAQLFLVHHLERVAEARARLPFHLAEDEPAAAADDQVELVAAGPDVGAEDAVAAETVVAGGAGLVRVAMRTQAR